MRRAVAAGLLAWCCAAAAHPLAPALLELREIRTGEYEVLWRTSATRTRLQDVSPQLPARCAPTGPSAVEAEGRAVTLRWSVGCGEPLAGEVLLFRGLERSVVNVIVRVVPLQGAVVEGLLDARRPSFTVPAPTEPASALSRYFKLGVSHLLSGIDHLLFIGGLLLLLAGWRWLLYAVTAFTVGHSITLALATLGYLSLNAALAELGIALSILVLACELARPDPDSWLRRRPWFAAAAFGLLHGLGFAGALAEAGLPTDAIPLALLGFNLGIEAAQLGIIGAYLLLAGALSRALPSDRLAGVARLSLTYIIGALAAFWCIERSTVFLS